MPVPIEWDLTGKTAIVTADRRGWTPYLVSALAEAGADIAVAGADGSDAAEAAEAVREHGRTALIIETDVTRSEEVEAAVRSFKSSGRRTGLPNYFFTLAYPQLTRIHDLLTV